jgi:hypothetical protein
MGVRDEGKLVNGGKGDPKSMHANSQYTTSLPGYQEIHTSYTTMLLLAPTSLLG